MRGASKRLRPKVLNRTLLTPNRTILVARPNGERVGEIVLGFIVDDLDAPAGHFTRWLMWNAPRNLS